MIDEKINLWLEELYGIDPSLREHEASLRKIIPQMMSARPESPFSPELAQKIKSRLNRELEKTKTKNMTNQEPRFWRPALLWSFSVVAVLFITIFTYQAMLGAPAPLTSLVQKEEIGVKKVAANAYGSLNTKGVVQGAKTGVSGIGAGGSNETTKALSAAPASLLATPTVAATETTDASTAVTKIDATTLVGERMIMPVFNYRYSYQGEPLDLSGVKNTVYRRIISDNSRAVANLLSGLSVGDFKLSSLSNLKATYVSIAEDKPYGLTASFDFTQDSVSLYPSWDKWQNAARNACQDEACWQSFRVKISDIPSNEVLISETKNFLTQMGVDLTHYGEGWVSDSWKRWYDQAENKDDYYLPESVGVVYPLIIDNQPVSGQSGEPDGLFVSYNVLEKRVSDAGAFTPYRYEASEYTIETSSERLLKLAESGGWNNYGNFYSAESEAVNLSLGTPHQGLVRFFSYSNNTSQELYAPALIFPITNIPDNYYGSNNVVVPLTLDLINELEQRNTSFDNGGGIMPLVK